MAVNWKRLSSSMLIMLTTTWHGDLLLALWFLLGVPLSCGPANVMVVLWHWLILLSLLQCARP
jgi:hypothetical protein